ncbi:MAG: PDZ domain-containing protein, partial [bacterium]
MRKTLFNIIVLVMALTSLYPAFCFGQNRRERFAPVGGGTPIPLGITISDVPRNSQIMGALVTNVEAGGIGEKAGLMYGDIIVIIAGNRISSVADAGKYMRIIAMSNNMGKTTDIGIVRDGQEMTLSTAGGGAQQKGPWLGIGMKDAPRDWGVEGVLATDVAAESPAYQAGILAGDIITGINGLPVRSVSDLQKVLSVITTGQIFKVTVRRGGQSNDISVEAQEKPAAGVVSSSAKRRLSDINILKYAFIDPQSRSVILVGKYDPDYKTGPIPYYELLNDAISSPYPWFSLEPTQETLNNVNV